MSGFARSTALGRLAVVGTMALCCGAVPGVAYGGEASGASGGKLWGAVTIEPGREGILEVAGYNGSPLATGSVLTLTAPDGTAVTGLPLNAGGYRGAVAGKGSSGRYTFTGTGTSDASPTSPATQTSWKDRTFPFVLSVPATAEPGIRPPGCTLLLKDAHGAVKESGTCEVTVGLPAPTLTRPDSGVPLTARPETSGTAYPGAQVTVRDEEEKEVCATTAAADGAWSCTPSTDLPSGPGRLQATATFNGVSAHSEQIDIIVGNSPAPQPPTVSDSGGGGLPGRGGLPGSERAAKRETTGGVGVCRA
jgi:hypothetical protein